MKQTEVTLTELRKSLGKLVNRAAYGGERIVLISRGQPLAALVGIDDLRRLDRASGASARTAEARNALAAADRLRARIERWQREHGVESEEMVGTLENLREARLDELSGMR